MGSPFRRDTVFVLSRIAAFTAVTLLLFAAGLGDAVRASPTPKKFYSFDAASARRTPWTRRQRLGVEIAPDDAPTLMGVWGLAHRGLVPVAEARRLGLRPRRRGAEDIAQWPREPKSPIAPRIKPFSKALGQLCPPGSPVASIASAVLSSSREFGTDPFLLAALVFQASRCEPQVADSYGVGLTRINPPMYASGLFDGEYHFGQPNGHGGFGPGKLVLSRHPFSSQTLSSIAPNLYFAAAFLAAFEKQCPAVDRVFESVPHRSHVSHFVWGDRVRATLPEEQILIARRRLLEYYRAQQAKPMARLGNTMLGSPLDGAPRLVIGVMGENRGGGKRIHAGIDLDAAIGEPVRAMAPGVVTFAGCDLGQRGLLSMSPQRAQEVPLERMGPRGIFVTVLHDDGFESLYSHLADYHVKVGARVRRSDLLGHVGRTGIQVSDAHLHLGLLVDRIAVDPLPLLAPYAVRANVPDPAEARAAKRRRLCQSHGQGCSRSRRPR